MKELTATGTASDQEEIGAIVRFDGLQRFGGELVDDGEEALFLGGELLVEGLGGDAGELRDLRVGQFAVAFVEGQMDDRAEHPRALVVTGQEGRGRGRDVGRLLERDRVEPRGRGRAVGLDPVEQFVGDRAQLADAVFADAVEDDVADAADDRAGGDRGQRRGVGRDPEGGGHEALVGVAGEMQSFARLAADAERVDQHEMGALGSATMSSRKDLQEACRRLAQPRSELHDSSTSLRERATTMS